MRALHLVTGTDALRQEASALSNVSSAYWMLGDRSSEMAYLTRAIDAQRRTGDEASLALQLHNAGTSLQTVGEYQKALVNLREALAIRTRLKNVRGQASTMNGIGEVYRDLGRLQEALDYHTRAAALRRTTEDREGLGQSLNNVGLTYRGLGDFAKARACYEEALQLRRATKNRRAEAIVLLNLGVLEYADVKNLPAGLAYLREAQAINEALNNVPNLANVLRHTGRIEQLRGEYAAAESLFLRSLELARQVRTWPVQVDVLEQLASIAAARGDLDRARAHLEAAIGVIESERRLLFGDSFRAAFLAANPRIYPAYVETLMQLHGRDPAGGYDARALQAAEQFRARSLLDLLGEANVDLGRDVDPALVTRAAALQADIDKASRRVDQLRAAKQDESRRAETELTARVAEYQELRAQIRADHPHVAALAEPRPLSVADIQREVVDPESVLLEYSLGAERSYLWVVTPSEIRSFVLPPRAAIDPVARRIHDLLTVRNHRDPVETIGTWRRRLQDAERELDGALRSLSRMLIEPAASLLSNKRLLIVAGESLQYVPFAALPAPGGATPLIVSHEVVTLPSASTLAALRRDRAGRASPPGRVAILADPVFDGADPRLASRRRTPANAGGSSGAGVADSSRSEWRRVAQDVRAVGEDGRLPRLRYSRDEARAISALVPPANRLLALDFSATRALVESARLRQYRIVHIAAHGFVDSRRPELSGLALSMVDEKGQPVDGFLRLHHIYELKLPADLVVLSACQTAVGADIRGEGVISLTRGFMYAGASAVAATLWKVDDRATAELMTMFYREMLGPSRRSPAAALRAAQVAMRARPRWRSPYYWAAIMLQGEWR
jgi:CHAT domain-containing protein